MTTFLRLLPLVAGAASLAGCGGLLTSDEPPEHEYWLEAVTLRLGEPSTENLPDIVVAVRAAPGLDTNRILVKGPGARLNHYAGARWPDHLPEVVAATVRHALESSGRFNRVSGASRTRRDEWSLDLELREFFTVVSAARPRPEARVRLAGHLACGGRESAVSASTTAVAREDRLAAIVAAFQQATDGAMISLGEQLQSRCFSGQALPATN